MAGHLNRRTYCARKGCGGTFRDGEKCCPRCGGTSSGRVRWRARYPDPSRGGTRQIERQFRTKREAQRWLTQQQSGLDRGDHVNPKDTERRFCDLVDAWRGTWLELEPKTRVGYESILGRHVLARWSDARLAGITPEAVQEWINALAASGLKPATIRRIYAVLRQVLGVAVERRYLTMNPCDAVRLPRRSAVKGHTEREMLFLSAEEVATLAEAINPRYRVLIYTAAYTGLRAGELWALRRRDVDLLHGSLNVERALKDINTSSEHVEESEKGLVFGPTKTHQRRTVVLPQFLRAMLAEHLDELPGGPDSLLFPARNGGPVRHGNFYRRHYKPTVKAALPPAKHALRFHDLRHTCASMLIAAGAHPMAIKEHLGHRDIRTTMNDYGHLYSHINEALAAALDATYSADSDPAKSKVADLPLGTLS